MTFVKIKHAQFHYFEDTGETAVHAITGDEVPLLASRFATFGQTVDIPRQEDYDKGKKFDAFDDVEGDDLDDAQQVDEQVAEEDADEEVADDEDVSAFTHDELVAWIRDDQPPAKEVVSSAGNDPDKARKLMAAEEEASGSQPRKSVMDPLRKIAGD
jgi:hypothetical protein